MVNSSNHAATSYRSCRVRSTDCRGMGGFCAARGDDASDASCGNTGTIAMRCTHTLAGAVGSSVGPLAVTVPHRAGFVLLILVPSLAVERAEQTNLRVRFSKTGTPSAAFRVAAQQQRRSSLAGWPASPAPPTVGDPVDTAALHSPRTSRAGAVSLRATRPCRVWLDCCAFLGLAREAAAVGACLCRWRGVHSLMHQRSVIRRRRWGRARGTRRAPGIPFHALNNPRCAAAAHSRLTDARQAQRYWSFRRLRAARCIPDTAPLSSQR